MYKLEGPSSTWQHGSRQKGQESRYNEIGNGNEGKASTKTIEQEVAKQRKKNEELL